MQDYVLKDFNSTNRFYIGDTKKKIGVIVWTCIFCVDKTSFLRPGHNGPFSLFVRTSYFTSCSVHA